MSIARIGDPRASLLAYLGVAPEQCVLCAKPPDDPIIFLHLPVDLALHSRFAEKLGGDLIFEGRRAAIIARGGSLLAGIDPHWHESAWSAPR
jgi:hypothetical protein